MGTRRQGDMTQDKPIYTEESMQRQLSRFFAYSSVKYGIDGLFLASVYSPKYSDPNEHPMSHLHAVICDKNFNIVFDPNPNYDGILCYPYSKLIGYNGIRAIDTFNKLK